MDEKKNLEKEYNCTRSKKSSQCFRHCASMNKQQRTTRNNDAIFSSQRFYGFEKEFREGIQFYAHKRIHNKGEPNYFRLKDKTN